MAVTVTVPGPVAVRVDVTCPLTLVVPEVVDNVATPGVAPEPATLRVTFVLYTAVPAASFAVIVNPVLSVPPITSEGTTEAMLKVEPVTITGICTGVAPATVAVTVAVRLVGSVVPEENTTVACPDESVTAVDALN